MANYYLKFISQYATITAPMRNLLKKDSDWNWTEQCQAAFEKVKASLTTSPVLSHFSSLASTFVTCDASSTALGAVLSQEVDGQEKPIAYASRALTDAEKKYSVGEREALACIWACEHWHVYLYGRQFTLRTGHQALTTLLSSSGTGRRPLRLHRWSDRLHQYTFTTTYRPGSQNQVADCLSRTPKILSGPASTSQEPVQLLTAPLDNIITLHELRRASGNDDLLCQVCTFTINGWPCTIEDSLLWPFYQIREEFSVWNDSCLAEENVRSYLHLCSRRSYLWLTKAIQAWSKPSRSVVPECGDRASISRSKTMFEAVKLAFRVESPSNPQNHL